MWTDYFDTAASTLNHIPRFHLAPRRCVDNIFNLLMCREVAPRSKASKRLWSANSKGGFAASGKDARRGIISWVEAKSLCHFSAKYCPLEPFRWPISVALSPDGSILASTYIDHTIKIIDCQSGNCLKVLSGHRSIPYAIRFHPTCPRLLASGGLDHEVRLWDANTAECTRSRDFDRPITDIAFHAQGELLAVACGCELYIWHFNEVGDMLTPTIVLETRNLLLVVHFHPLAAPFLLTSEYNDRDSSYSSMTLATSHSNTSSVVPNERSDRLLAETEPLTPESAVDSMDNSDAQPDERSTQPFTFPNALFWDLPILQGWLIMSRRESSSGQSGMLSQDIEAWLTMQMGARSNMRPSSRHRASRSREASSILSVEAAAVPQYHGDHHPLISRIQSALSMLLEDVAVEELPRTKTLRIWPYDINDPCAALEVDKCRLTIPHAVLLRETGVHFSPCGKFLAVCVACMPLAGDFEMQILAHHDVSGAASPTRHPISAQPVIYELRIYSLEEATFGLVLASRALRAAHCLTSIQFSPTSEHLLLAYGKCHKSLLKHILFRRETFTPIYTILEVYRVSDMELVTVLPSAVDRVSMACFHPSVGRGLAYGTMEGKLRILQYDSSNSSNCMISNFVDDSFLEVLVHAL